MPASGERQQNEVQPGAEQDVLPDARGRGAGERVLREPAAADHLGSRCGQDRMVGVAAVIADELLGLCTEQRGGVNVGENRWLAIDCNMSRPAAAAVSAVLLG